MNLKNVLGTVVNYTLFRNNGNKSTLIGPTHTDQLKDCVVVTQRDPVSSKNEMGYRRTDLQLQTTVMINEPTGPVAKVLRFDLSASIPVGTPEATVLESAARIASMADDDALIHDVLIVGKRPV